jgi:hypothetical protein
MNIGKRIEQRLLDLHWERNDLLSRVPDLSAQALSNLIRRDSKRSEWDEVIAAALGVSVLWLVYGRDTHEYLVAEKAANYNPSLSDDEQLLIRAFREGDDTEKTVLRFVARACLKG